MTPTARTCTLTTPFSKADPTSSTGLFPQRQLLLGALQLFVPLLPEPATLPALGLLSAQLAGGKLGKSEKLPPLLSLYLHPTFHSASWSCYVFVNKK